MTMKTDVYHCPKCNSPLDFDGAYYQCSNTLCSFIETPVIESNNREDSELSKLNLDMDLSESLDSRLIRQHFESEYLGNNKKTAIRNEHGDYVLPSIQDAWAGWLAASKYYGGG